MLLLLLLFVVVARSLALGAGSLCFLFYLKTRDTQTQPCEGYKDVVVERGRLNAVGGVRGRAVWEGGGGERGGLC